MVGLKANVLYSVRYLFRDLVLNPLETGGGTETTHRNPLSEEKRLGLKQWMSYFLTWSISYALEPRYLNLVPRVLVLFETDS